jgi:hypothetical protein
MLFSDQFGKAEDNQNKFNQKISARRGINGYLQLHKKKYIICKLL